LRLITTGTSSVVTDSESPKMLEFTESSRLDMRPCRPANMEMLDVGLSSVLGPVMRRTLKGRLGICELAWEPELVRCGDSGRHWHWLRSTSLSWRS